MSLFSAIFRGFVAGIILSYPYYVGSFALFGDWHLIVAFLQFGLWVRLLHIRLEVSDVY